MRSVYEIANWMTPARRRAEAMGWAFDNLEILAHENGDDVLRGQFTCVCGRVEYFSLVLGSKYTFNHQKDFNRQFDFAQRLQEYGSFSRSHLLEDGYTEEQISEVEARGKAFDLGEKR